MNTEHKWKVKQGTSSGVVTGETYEDAKARAAQIGFSDPESIVLLEKLSRSVRCF